MRHILISILVMTNLASAGWILYLKTKPTAFQSPYPLIDLARNFIPQEDFIVNIQPLREDLQSLIAKEEPNSISLYFEFLNTGANIQINQNLRIWPASLAKLPLTLAVMKKIESGVWQLNDQLVLLEGDKDNGSGNLHLNSIGTAFPIEQLLKELLSNSDNTAYRILLRNMSTPELRPIIEETGLDDFFDKEGRVSAKEYSRLFRTLYTSSFLKRENSSLILKWLSESSFNRYLGAGVPDSVIFPHKWGTNRDVHVFADSGIVYAPNRPYILTVMVEDKQAQKDDAKVQELMKTISDTVYRYVSQVQS